MARRVARHGRDRVAPVAHGGAVPVQAVRRARQRGADVGAIDLELHAHHADIVSRRRAERRRPADRRARARLRHTDRRRGRVRRPGIGHEDHVAEVIAVGAVDRKAAERPVPAPVGTRRLQVRIGHDIGQGVRRRDPRHVIPVRAGRHRHHIVGLRRHRNRRRERLLLPADPRLVGKRHRRQ